jgi:hypothetical protein
MFTIILALVKGEKHRSISRSRCERNALTLELRHRTEKSQASSSQKLVTPWIISQNKQMNYIGCHTTWQIWFLYMQWANNYDVIFKATVERSHLSFSHCKRLFKAPNFIHYLTHPCPHSDNVISHQPSDILQRLDDFGNIPKCYRVVGDQQWAGESRN